MTTKGRVAVIALVAAALLFTAYWIGRKQSPKNIRMYSDMTSQVSGHKTYLIDTPVVCPSGIKDGKPQPPKYIGQIKLDLDLHTGALVVVENSVPPYFTCQ